MVCAYSAALIHCCHRLLAKHKDKEVKLRLLIELFNSGEEPRLKPETEKSRFLLFNTIDAKRAPADTSVLLTKKRVVMNYDKELAHKMFGYRVKQSLPDTETTTEPASPSPRGGGQPLRLARSLLLEQYQGKIDELTEKYRPAPDYKTKRLLLEKTADTQHDEDRLDAEEGAQSPSPSRRKVLLGLDWYYDGAGHGSPHKKPKLTQSPKHVSNKKPSTKYRQANAPCSTTVSSKQTLHVFKSNRTIEKAFKEQYVHNSMLDIHPRS